MLNLAASALVTLLCLLILCKRYHSSVNSVNNINKKACEPLLLTLTRTHTHTCTQQAYGLHICDAKPSLCRLWVAFLCFTYSLQHSRLHFDSKNLCASMFVLAVFHPLSIDECRRNPNERRIEYERE